ncbi:MAG: IS66 family transposase [Deltaproteobacteria bacterium]|nr:MAG: IS66 family transposase [Deltaproteobacteria bacterium]
MSKFIHPPPNFQCPYQRSCPHLDLLSTTWVLGEYRRGEKRYQEHLRILDRLHSELKSRGERIRVLERENAEIKAKLKMLHQRQFKANTKKTESGKKEDGPACDRKKRGAPVGHPGWSRAKPDHIDQTIHVPAPTECPHCQKTDLLPSREIHEHMQEDIVIKPRTLVTNYVHAQAFCTHCNRLVVKTGAGEILNAPIGPVAKSAAIYLRYRIGISYRKTTELFRDLFGLTFVPAAAVGFDRKASACGTPLHDDLREKIQMSDLVHADETSWRNDGIGHYVWFAGNEKLAFFHIARSRSAEVAKTIFGQNYQGIVVRDRYAAYNGIGSEWQSCLAHIITKAKELKREHGLLPLADKEALTDRFCEQVGMLFTKACQTSRKLRSGQLPWSSAAAIEQRYVRLLCRICKKTLSFKPAETLRKYLVGPEQKSLFTFLRHAGVPPTNNHAEQSLRNLVIFRKTSFGTRSESGMNAHSILASLVQTARRQGVQPRQFLQTLLTADAPTAQAALYNNSG